VGVGVWECGWVWERGRWWVRIEWGLDPHKIGQKTTSKIVFSGAPGRGVLRFFAGGYRNPVHFLAIFRVFSKN